MSLPDHLYRVEGRQREDFDGEPSDTESYRRDIEPWLSAVFQSEHLSLLLGSGFTIGVAEGVEADATGMAPVEFDVDGAKDVDRRAVELAAEARRGQPNIEDQLRAALHLVGGLEVLGDKRVDAWENAISEALREFATSILKTERGIADGLGTDDERGQRARAQLVSFLLSFVSRAPSRERLHLFTTNYDRLVEFGCDLVGLRPLDRFVGALSPVFRASRLDVDMHYNPPGIRGEPRYLEGVLRLTKLHGSIDWRFEDRVLRRVALGFGASGAVDLPENPYESLIVYPNPAKDVETIEYPYAELFRDYSAALCRPNSALITYGYGFGDDHINRVIADMLTIPSTHVVVIAYGDPGGRIAAFLEHVGHAAQISLLIGSHFGDLPTLVDHYLPKPAIDTITIRRAELERRREIPSAHQESGPMGPENDGGRDGA